MSETLATRVQAIDHREALFAAVAGLPTQEGDWSIPEPILVHAGLRHDVPRARQIVMAFASWAAEAVRSLPFAPRAQLQATDFNDYYKLVMSRVEYLYQKTLPAQGAATDAQLYPICTFETQLRRRPQYTKNGVTRTLGVFDTAPSPDRAYSYADVRAAFVDALRAVGARRFDAATLRSLLESRAPSMAGMEESLRALTDEWVAKLCEAPLFVLLEEGQPFSGGESVECRIEPRDGGVRVLAQGPWFRVTFVETAVLQCMTEFMTDCVNADADAGGTEWARDALMAFALTSHQVQDRVHEPGHGVVSFFSSRRAPSGPFHLLQNMYLQRLWGKRFTTSSLYAGRVLGGMPLIGTWAHEGPMAFMGLYADLDGSLPLSSVLWTMLFWAATSNKSILPDGCGSAAYKAAICGLGLFEDVAMARQDSGSLERFASLFNCPRMASEVETFATLEEGIRHGYVAFGAGGFFGEKRLRSVELSIAAKITRVLSSDGSGGHRPGYGAKIGDFSGGSWMDYDPQKHEAKALAKFIASEEVPKAEIFERMIGYARRGDAAHDAAMRGEAVAPLLSRADALRFATALRQMVYGDALGATNGGLSHIRQRLVKYADRVEKAAEALPNDE